MEAEGIAPSAVSAFESTFNSLVSGNTGLIPESTIAPAPDLEKAETFTGEPDTSLLASTVVLKLNGGLGTGMGLDKAKSLLRVKGDDTFLDLTAKQIVAMREEFKSNVKFMLMNSFSTSADTLEFLQKGYPALAGEAGLEMMQNKVPKIDATTFEVSYAEVVVVVPFSSPVIETCDFTILPEPCLTSSLLLFVCFFFCPIDSLPHAKVIPPTNGAHLDTAIFMLPWRDPVVWILSWLTDTSTCLCPTLITWELLWIFLS